MQPLDDAATRQLMDVLAGRRTINLFDDRPAPEAILLDAIDAARWAPNHRLTQPWRFHLFGSQTRAKIIERDIELAVAKNGEAAAPRRRERLQAVPGWFAVTSARCGDDLVDRENYAASACAVQNLCLYLWAKGVGVKWTTGAVTRDARFFEVLGIDPLQYQVVGMFWYGYPAHVPEQKRLPCEEIIARLP
ncbi:MAG: nitroreductase [Pseudomonadota bacterium]